MLKYERASSFISASPCMLLMLKAQMHEKSKQRTSEGVFTLGCNGCNGTLARCAAEMPAFEVDGEGMSVHNNVYGSATLYG